jgi:hypothetical protein
MESTRAGSRKSSGTSRSRNLQLEDFGGHAPAFDDELRHCHRKSKTARADAPSVQVEHAVFRLQLGLCRNSWRNDRHEPAAPGGIPASTKCWRAIAARWFARCLEARILGIFRVGKHRRRDRPHIARRRLNFERSAVRAIPRRAISSRWNTIVDHRWVRPRNLEEHAWPPSHAHDGAVYQERTSPSDVTRWEVLG